MPAPRRVAITGAPGAGKSALVAELGRRGYDTSAEVARRILAAPGGMALRADQPLEFALAMLDAQLTAWQDADASEGLVVFDRGFCDIAGFLELEGLPVPSEIDHACRSFRFEGPVFRAAPWQSIYRPDSERIQTWAEAVASDQAITASWHRYGYELCDLPLVAIADRVAFVEKVLDGG